MAIIKLTKRISNPRKAASAASRTSAGRSASGRFVAKRSRTRKPINRRKTKAKNPALLVTLGAINPYKGKTTMAKRKRSSLRRPATARKRRTARRRTNPATKIIVMSPRKRNTRRRRSMRRSNPVVRRRKSFRRRNPSIMGMNMSTTGAATAVLGGLVGVALTKTITAMLPAGLVGSPIMRVIASGAIAFASGMLLSRVSSAFGGAAAFGGYMQTGSVAVNAFIPGIGSRLSLGDLVPGSFSVPMNPITAGQMAALPAADSRITTNGLARAYTPAY